MRRNSVRKKIFLSNTLMVVLILLLFLSVNVIVLEKHRHHNNDTNPITAQESTETKSRFEEDSFILLFVADGAVSIGILLGISLIFTNRITKRILMPLKELNKASERIRQGDLTQDICYSGEREFEEVCSTFNDMQKKIREERAQNARYEKARTDMIAGISHDIRTPLTAIRGTVTGLKDGIASTPEMQEKFLDTALRRTMEMDALLDQLFFFSKLETGKLPIQMTSVSLGEFTESYAAEKRDDPRLSELSFSAECKNDLLTMQADPLLLRRILDNLLENSRKYAAGPDLAVKLEISSEKGRILILFSDNGPGVSEEALSHLFEEFYREDTSRNKEKGNGLGLYIVKHLTEAMGGRVSAENPGGLCITLVFPEEGAKS